MVRDATLVAGTNLDQLVRPGARRRVSRPILIGAGLVATVAVAVVALVHVAGVDARTWLAPGQPGVLPALLDALTDEEAQPEAP